MKKKSLLDITELADKRIPVALAAILLLQAGTAVWWAASKDSEDHYIAARVENLEAESNDRAELRERLARIEERLKAQAESLQRIEKHLEGTR